MSLFSRLFLKDKEPSSGSESGIAGTQVGDVFEFEYKDWTVEEVALYNWDNGAKDYEFTMESGGAKLFLNYCGEDGRMSLYWPAKINQIWEHASSRMKQGGDMSEAFTFEGETYSEIDSGSAKVSSANETYEMENWLCEAKDGKHLVSFNKYEDGSVEAYLGKWVDQYVIKRK